LRENRAREYERFRKRFALSSYTKEIGEVLDEEPEVSRFYAELVPLQISAEEFWSRMFFRLQLLTRTGNVNFEEDDEEEELVWEDDQEVVVESNSGATVESKANSELNDQDIRRLYALEKENENLKQEKRSLELHAIELENVIRQKDDVILQLRQSLEATAAAQASTSNAAVVNPGSKNSPNGADSASNSSSEESVQMVNHSDANSLYTDEDSRHGEKTILVSRGDITSTPAATVNKVAITTGSSSSLRSKTAPYLAALDDEEEDSWT